MKTDRHFSRRALLAATTGLAAAPLISWVARERLPLLTQARGVPSAFLASLVERLETHFAEAGRPVRIEPLIATQHGQLSELAQNITGDALLFAGASWARAWRDALPSSARPLQLSLGAELDGATISAALWQGLELGGLWSAGNLGPRAAVLVAADQAASDLPLAFEHGLTRGGGELVRRVVALPGRAAEAWRALEGARLDVVAVLASGAEGAAIWRTAPAGLATLTHAWSGGEGRGHVVHESRPALDTLAARVVAQLQGRTLPSAALHLTAPSGLVTPLGTADSATLTTQSPLALRNRSAFPFTGC